MIKIPIRHDVPISSSVDYRHPSWFFIGDPATAQATIYCNWLVPCQLWGAK
jgi:hypothetical protein